MENERMRRIYKKQEVVFVFEAGSSDTYDTSCNFLRSRLRPCVCGKPRVTQCAKDEIFTTLVPHVDSGAFVVEDSKIGTLVKYQCPS